MEQTNQKETLGLNIRRAHRCWLVKACAWKLIMAVMEGPGPVAGLYELVARHGSEPLTPLSQFATIVFAGWFPGCPHGELQYDKPSRRCRRRWTELLGRILCSGGIVFPSKPGTFRVPRVISGTKVCLVFLCCPFKGTQNRYPPKSTPPPRCHLWEGTWKIIVSF